MEEIFKIIKGTRGKYEISNFGRLYSNIRNTFLKGGLDTHGYRYFVLRINGRGINYLQHRLMAEYFIPNPNNYEIVHHISCIKDDNRLENLEWTTLKENTQRAWRDGLCPLTEKQRVARAKMFKERLSKPIMQLTKEGILCKKYESGCEAGRINGLRQQGISACARGELKIYGGYIWQYI